MFRFLCKLARLMWKVLRWRLYYFFVIVFLSIGLELLSALVAVPLIFAFLGNLDIAPIKLPFISGMEQGYSVLILGALLVFLYGVLSVFRMIVLRQNLSKLAGRLQEKRTLKFSLGCFTENSDKFGN